MTVNYGNTSKEKQVCKQANNSRQETCFRWRVTGAIISALTFEGTKGECPRQRGSGLTGVRKETREGRIPELWRSSG